MYTCTFIYRYKFWIEVIYVNGYLLRFFLFLFLFLSFSFRMNEWMNLCCEWANVFCSCTCSAIGYSISQSITIYAWCVCLTWLVAMDFLLRKTRTSSTEKRLDEVRRQTLQSERKCVCEIYCAPQNKLMYEDIIYSYERGPRNMRSGIEIAWDFNDNAETISYEYTHILYAINECDRNVYYDKRTRRRRIPFFSLYMLYVVGRVLCRWKLLFVPLFSHMLRGKLVTSSRNRQKLFANNKNYERYTYMHR